MLSRLLYVPLGLGAAICLYFGTQTDNIGLNIIGVMCMVALAINYTLAPQINWWYHQRRPAQLDAASKRYLEQHFPFYQQLNETGKLRFQERLAMFQIARKYTPVHLERLTDDVKLAVGASAILLSFGQKEYLFEHLETIIIYPNGFLSPRYPKQMHTTESHLEDGALMLSARHLMHGFMQPQQYYNNALHEWIQIWKNEQDINSFPTLPESIWQDLAKISGFPHDKLKEWIGLDELDEMVVTIYHFLLFSTAFETLLPQVHKSISTLLNLNPIQAAQPILFLNRA